MRNRRAATAPYPIGSNPKRENNRSVQSDGFPFFVIFVFLVSLVRNANLRCRIIANDRFLTKATKATRITKKVASKRRLSQPLAL